MYKNTTYKYSKGVTFFCPTERLPASWTSKVQVTADPYLQLEVWSHNALLGNSGLHAQVSVSVAQQQSLVV